MQTNICKFEPNLPMFRNFSVNWGQGVNSLEKKIKKSKPEAKKAKETKLDPDVCVWGRGFQIRPYFNSMAVKNVQIYRKGNDTPTSYIDLS